MKYTYQISYDGTNYSSLIPSNELEMEGKWVNDTMIWRENLRELKVTKSEDPTNYNTLESYFEDNTKFETRIYVKILNNNVQESLQWFGIKWGKLNKDTGVYTVDPKAYDIWGQYFEANIDRRSNTYDYIANYNTIAKYYDTTGNLPYLGTSNTTYRLMGVLKGWVNNVTAFPASDVVSTFIDGDDYENGSSASTTYGYLRDYVTDGRSYMDYMTLKIRSTRWSFTERLRFMKLFRVFCFVDSNDKLRFEHIKFFNDKLTDNAVDFSSYLRDYDNIFEYQQTELIPLEKITLTTTSDDTDLGFSEAEIVYSDIRNRPDMVTREHTFNAVTNIATYGSDTISDNIVLFGGVKSHVYKLNNVDFSVYSSDNNSFNLTWSATNQRCESNDIQIISGQDYDLTVYLSTLSGVGASLQIYFEDGSDGTLLSNKITAGSTGTTNGTLTTTGGANDAVIVIDGWSGTSCQAIGFVIVTHDDYTMIPSIQDTSSTVKTNGSVSIDNIIDRWWKHDRPAKEGDVNGSSVTFTDTEFNLKREKIRFKYPDTINPLYGFNDGTRIGKIESWTRSLETDFYDINVIYQEDE